VRRRLFGLTIFLSAFLLFQVQLIVAKSLLPWFGGAATVWTTCQLFFQVSLLAGYSYAHLLARRRELRWQGRIHLAFLLAAVAALGVVSVWSGMPLLAPEAMKPNGTEQPAALLLLILALTVGLPFFVLSTTGPLVQRWHSHTTDSLDRTYRLYAISNAGSLLGLLSYPVAFERVLDLEQQAGAWTALFVVFAVSCGFVAWRTTAAADFMESTIQRPQSNGDGARPGAITVPDAWRPWLWLLLSFSGSAMFLSTTNQLSLEVSAVPFLWVLPLGLYLVTFIICFDRPQWYSRRWFTIGSALATPAVLMLSSFGISLRIPYQVLAYSLFLALFCMVCHGELARLRPGSSGLTRFYLLIACGGALGGLFVGLAAPAFFSDVWEFHIALLCGWIVVGLIGLVDRVSPCYLGDRWQFALVTMIACIWGVYVFIVSTNLQRTALVVRYDWRVPLVAGVAVACLACVVLWRSRLAAASLWPRALVVLMVLIGSKGLYERIDRFQDRIQFAARDFYGVVRVRVSEPRWDGKGVRELVDGNTVHGVQLFGTDRNRPAAYYSPSSGIAAAVRYLARRAGNLHFGILGMGAGTMAAFARPGDRVRYYELNPTIIEISRGSRPHFTFIRESAGEVTIVPGDGRLSLERELSQAKPQGFDLLAMDAFSSDAVPVHLLTEEAFNVYAAHLRDNSSILAVNITNRHLDLEPVVGAVARRFGFDGVRIDTKGDPPVPRPSSWILLSRDRRAFHDPSIVTAGPRPLGDRWIPFTDRYSNLFRVLK
jgi:hypothetical protein